MKTPSYIRYHTANNPGYMTLQGTNQYIVGRENVIVIDVALSGAANLDGIIGQVEAMGALLGDMIDAGAIGFSTGRSTHEDGDGNHLREVVREADADARRCRRGPAARPRTRGGRPPRTCEHDHGRRLSDERHGVRSRGHRRRTLHDGVHQRQRRGRLDPSRWMDRGHQPYNRHGYDGMAV
jgi:hypothetical protein